MACIFDFIYICEVRLTSRLSAQKAWSPDLAAAEPPFSLSCVETDRHFRRDWWGLGTGALAPSVGLQLIGHLSEFPKPAVRQFSSSRRIIMLRVVTERVMRQQTRGGDRHVDDSRIR